MKLQHRPPKKTTARKTTHSKGSALARWLASARPGRCPGCGNRLPVRWLAHRLICGAPRCRSKYQAKYREDHAPPTALRRIVRSRIRADGARLLLECGHTLEMLPSRALRRARRRKCAQCSPE